MTGENLLRTRLRGFDCLYCGEVAETEEHFPPSSHSALGFILPACRECNSFAGTEWPDDFEARAQHVKGKLAQRYAKEIATPEWRDDELRQLGPNLRREAIRWRKRCEIARRRIVWNAIVYLLFIDRNNDFVVIDADFAHLGVNAPRWFRKPWRQERAPPRVEAALAVDDFW